MKKMAYFSLLIFAVVGIFLTVNLNTEIIDGRARCVNNGTTVPMLMAWAAAGVFSVFSMLEEKK